MPLEYLHNFHLVGGTGLALQLGHRNSVDIDLFTFLDFNTEELSQKLASDFKDNYIERSAKAVMLFCYINNVKSDFVNTRVPLLFDVQHIEGIRFADIRDIALLKFQAILKRGSKKDFVDLYAILHEFGIDELFTWFNKKYPNVDISQLLMSMTYFEDAEAEIMPQLYIKTDWKKIKAYIRSKVNEFIKN